MNDYLFRIKDDRGECLYHLSSKGRLVNETEDSFVADNRNLESCKELFVKYLRAEIIEILEV